jgi:hypothetical protein
MIDARPRSSSVVCVEHEATRWKRGAVRVVAHRFVTRRSACAATESHVVTFRRRTGSSGARCASPADHRSQWNPPIPPHLTVWLTLALLPSMPLGALPLRQTQLCQPGRLSRPDYPAQFQQSARSQSAFQSPPLPSPAPLVRSSSRGTRHMGSRNFFGAAGPARLGAPYAITPPTHLHTRRHPRPPPPRVRSSRHPPSSAVPGFFGQHEGCRQTRFVGPPGPPLSVGCWAQARRQTMKLVVRRASPCLEVQVVARGTCLEEADVRHGGTTKFGTSLGSPPVPVPQRLQRSRAPSWSWNRRSLSRSALPRDRNGSWSTQDADDDAALQQPVPWFDPRIAE